MSTSSVVMKACLRGKRIRVDGTEEDLGILSTELINNSFLAALVSTMVTGTNLISDFRYHDCGSGTTAASASDTELEEAYDGIRHIGIMEISGANNTVFRSRGTIIFDEETDVSEHGLFNSPVKGSGLMLDRSVFVTPLIFEANEGLALDYTVEFEVSV